MNSFKMHSVIRILHAEGSSAAQPAPGLALAEKGTPGSACSTAE